MPQEAAPLQPITDPVEKHAQFDLSPFGPESDERKRKAQEDAEAASSIEQRIDEDTGEHAVIPPEVAKGLGDGALSGAEIYGPPAPLVMEAGPGELPPDALPEDLPSAVFSSNPEVALNQPPAGDSAPDTNH